MHEVMTTDVVTVELPTPFRQIVASLYSHGISGMPVLDARERICGVISGADLAGARHATRTARDLMTAPARAIGPDATVEEAVRLLGRHRIGRLPVIDSTTRRLLGIVTRSDLLRVHMRSDEEISAEIENDVLPQILHLDPRHFMVHVRSGVVTILGHVDRRSVVPALVEVVGRVEGVLRVAERIDYDVDDRRPVSAIQWGDRT